MSIQQVRVANNQAMQTAVTSYVAQGFVVANQTNDGVTLQKTKKFNAAALLLVFIPFLGWIPLIIYLIIFAMKPAAKIIEIKVSQPTSKDEVAAKETSEFG